MSLGLGLSIAKSSLLQGLSKDLADKLFYHFIGNYDSGNLADSLGSGSIIVTLGDADPWTSKFIPETLATFAIPDDADFIAADGADAFWVVEGVIQQKTFTELINSTTLRTLIKYSSFEPWMIHELAILKPDAVLTEANKDELTRYFKLWPTYFGDMREFGYMKDNRIFDSVE